MIGVWYHDVCIGCTNRSGEGGKSIYIFFSFINVVGRRLFFTERYVSVMFSSLSYSFIS